MRLYPKKLRGIEDLERERKLLLKESRRMDDEGVLSMDGVLGKKKKDGEEKEGGGSLIDLLPVSNPVVNLLVKFIQRKLAQKANAPKQQFASAGEATVKRKHPLKAFAIEFIGGYLKWKAIELSYKGIRVLIKRHKEKKADRDIREF